MELETRTFEKNNNCYADSSSDIMSNRELKKFTKKWDNIFSCIFSNTFIVISRICNKVSKVQSNVVIYKLYHKSLAKRLLSGISKKVQTTELSQQVLPFLWYLGSILNLNYYMGTHLCINFIDLKQKLVRKIKTREVSCKDKTNKK